MGASTDILKSFNELKESSHLGDVIKELKKRIAKEKKEIKGLKKVPKVKEYDLKKLQNELKVKERTKYIQDVRMKNSEVELRRLERKNKLHKEERKSLENKLKNPKTSKIESKVILNRLKDVNDTGLMIFDTSHLKNEINQLSGKPFYYKINDGFNKEYKIKNTTLDKKENPEVFLLNKMKRGAKKTIKQYEKEINEIAGKKIKLKKGLPTAEDLILLNSISYKESQIKGAKKLLKALEFNLNFSLTGIRDLEILEEEDEEIGNTGDYPILMEITGATIDLYTSAR